MLLYVVPLDDGTAGRQSQDRIVWSDSLQTAFSKEHAALSTHHMIVLPCADDELRIVMDGAMKDCGIGATLYIRLGGKLRFTGFFSAKLQKQQVRCLPCEVEAMSIAVTTKDFSPYIIQSNHNACILTDSKLCVQAFEKLCRGNFFASPRVSTFLSVVSRYQALV